ncbi:MAG TPA: efflux RND transporter periplasmic adaptor subunit [Kofleriaceae bacterium]|nr:efflux RND transporter periplasmic adaptor subunit [Kofleriaceae bacterium]
MNADNQDHQEPEELGFALPPPARTSKATVIVALAVLVGGGLAFGLVRRDKDRAIVEAPAGEAKATRVEVMRPNVSDSDRAMTLPGTVKPLEQAKIFARTTGYVRKWTADIGDKVAAGQLLVELDVPDLDAALSQARAQLAQAKAAVKQVEAQRDFSKTNSARYEALVNQKLVAAQQAEQTTAQASTDEASVAAAESNVAAQAANVRRLEDTLAFARVVAPFAGTITVRNAERGNLVSENQAQELYQLVATDPVRVFVDVPQSAAPSVKVGTEATLVFREFPGRTFTGKVTRTSGALDPDLHTLSTEVQVANPDSALLPGMYGQVTLNFPVPHKVVEIPATALYSDANGLRVATVDAQQRLHYQPITIERDAGAVLQIATGLTGDERIIKIAVPWLLEGDPLEVTTAPASPADAKPADAKPGDAAKPADAAKPDAPKPEDKK